jgi:hypothetical protein
MALKREDGLKIITPIFRNSCRIFVQGYLSALGSAAMNPFEVSRLLAPAELYRWLRHHLLHGTLLVLIDPEHSGRFVPGQTRR